MVERGDEMAVPTTLEELEALPCEVLTCAQVAKILHADPFMIHEQARKDPSKLGFKVIVHGTRVKIPKSAFIAFMREK